MPTFLSDSTLRILLLAALLPASACGSKNSPAAGQTQKESTPDAAAKSESAKEQDAEPMAVAPKKEELEIGKPAPDFELPDLDGKTVKLSSFKGKIVVLEWYNPECPYVEYAHGKGPLMTLAKERLAADDKVVWLAINSGAPGKQGHGVELNRNSAKTYQMEHPILLDEVGKIGKLYGAVSTPQFYVVDAEGNLAYRGALDNAPLGRVPGDSKYMNYLTAALSDLTSGRPVAQPETKSYGCSVKYGS